MNYCIIDTQEPGRFHDSFFFEVLGKKGHQKRCKFRFPPTILRPQGLHNHIMFTFVRPHKPFLPVLAP